MKRGGQFVGLLVVTLMAMSTRTHGQTSEFAKLFRDFEARADGATPGTLEQEGPTNERLTQGSKESVARWSRRDCDWSALVHGEGRDPR